ncbi:sarcosine oxidase subunit gamma [Roseobacter denitrificans]|uniref:Sarcosine oxidase, gamma subunit n=1 Tax=Roseobacter denitrificans (strain ATCC 33942 / OCh 114) TaxID=375451 RepID=Q16E44_ROSDO|nr:sarcosine oxidase subunit gamma [Roseobacter denitrificans]ABG29749.1 sarcosine oxidase, gamma subunit [Roseobacter denitrificans OCh 114]AVL52985.1 sarcosine oxidase subunit gamma [Roseobacter denitrificans]SFG27808.1 sarcosine oxidase subunit gamma [Roseobacter denitrificans OCh 114]
MHDLIPITPLGGQAPRVDTVGAVTVTEVTDRALASVAARMGAEKAAGETLSKTIGAQAPAPSRLAGDTLSAFWTGPDQWMIEAPIDTHEDLAKQLVAAFGSTASATEQTDAWCRFDLSGPHLPQVMEILCPVDTHIWRGGEATRTSIDHLGCFLLCRDPQTFSVIGPRSSAGSLHHALLTACRAAL